MLNAGQGTQTLDNNDLHDIIDKAAADPSETGDIKDDAYLRKCEKTCKKAIRNVGRAQSLWYCVALLALLAAGAALYFASGMSFDTLKDINQWGFEHYTAIVVGVLCLFLSFSRISSNSSHLSKLKDRKKYLRGDLPQNSDRMLREIYFYYCKRRCTHYWLTVGFGAMFMLCILYPIVACGVDMLASWAWKPTKVKLFEWEIVKNVSAWQIEHKFFVMGVIGVFLALMQYFIFRDDYRKAIVAFEDRFGREKIVDECLYCSRMFKVNFRYKSFAFIIVCFCGCFFYLLCKRLICVIFDKSFTF